ncbi:hypothetical protein ACXWR7_12575, partial [Streptococcus pyogenes]
VYCASPLSLVPPPPSLSFPSSFFFLPSFFPSLLPLSFPLSLLFFSLFSLLLSPLPSSFSLPPFLFPSPFLPSSSFLSLL